MKVFLGMSGGVDSAVSAHLLKEQGHEVVGVYMKNWSKDLPGMKCPWAEDLADAKRTAVRLGIDFRVFDFESDYKQKVVDYMLEEYQKGNTPNPDIMCNQEIKFKLFADTAFEQGAELIATGHYAKSNGRQLLCAKDTNKDQSYFLYRITADVIERTLFPVGDMLKSEVKALAENIGLTVAHKPESMGVCFVGEANMKDFLAEFVETRPGKIIELETNTELGIHDGAIFYTLGQRHGLGLTQGLPYYVVKKDMAKNLVYVSRNLNAGKLWANRATLRDVVFRESASGPLQARIRHRAPLVPAHFDAETQTVYFDDAQKSLTPGQSVVLYRGPLCLGGGIIESTDKVC
ncbi:tRNA 2-thiouridine(34) synthase MnmA [Candidatus Saccharibacteria bacterium]|nr:tRNA 2-thiouridine(34) synthase MnmA [Candidatus Saccharibacteria bacterium]